MSERPRKPLDVIVLNEIQIDQLDCIVARVQRSTGCSVENARKIAIASLLDRGYQTILGELGAA